VINDADDVEVVLRGGPPAIPEADKIKIMHAGGYEHFERVPAGAVSQPTFQWVTRTEIAE
jgi:hypothetical protein